MNPLGRWQRLLNKFKRKPRYTTNFVKTKYGNGISQGEELIVKINGAEVVTGRIYDPKTGKTYQIDQSHAKDEDNNAETTNFTLKSNLHPRASKLSGYVLPIGEYVLFTWWWDNDTMRGGTYRDKFMIVA